MTVDGETCTVGTVTDEKITCVTGPKATVSVAGPQPGQPGITHSFVNPADENITPDWTTGVDGTYAADTTVSLATSMETLWNHGDSTAMHVFDGWFKAPADGNYRFYMQADDAYKLWLDSSNPYDPSVPVTTTLVEIGQQNWYRGYREYYHVEPATSSAGKFVTDYITLTAGTYYKLRGQHRDTGGGMFSTVSVEY